MNHKSIGKTIKIALAILGVLGLLYLIAFVWFVDPSTRVSHTPPDPVYSEDGSLVIYPTINFSEGAPSSYLCVRFEVKDTDSGTVLYNVQTYASGRMNWSLQWIGNDVIRLDSSDIGSYCWGKENGKWAEIECPL